MKVEVVLTEAEIAQEFAEAMQARDLPEKFLFWSPYSTQAWRNLSADEHLFGGLTATWSALSANSNGLSRHFSDRVPVISFGAGDGARDRLLLEGLKQVGFECHYFPVDASQSLLEQACAGADDDDFESTGIKADISSPVHLVYASDAAEPPRLFIMSGNTLGAFDPLAEVRYIAQCMRAGDVLIVDGEIYHHSETMARRDHPAVRRFVAALLKSAGIEETDGEIRFEDKTDDRHAGLHQITRSFRAERDLAASVNGEQVPLQRGELIGLNFQYSYTRDTFHWLLHQHGGFHIEQELPSADGRFLTAVCRK
jgi:hypothetical protein